MLLLSGKGAGASAGGIAVVIGAVVALFTGGNDQTTEPDPNGNQSDVTVEDGPDVEPVTGDLGGEVVINGGPTDPNGGGDNGGDTPAPDRLRAPKTTFAELLAGLEALFELDRPGRDEITAVFTGDVLRVPQFDKRSRDVYVAKLRSLVEQFGESAARTGSLGTRIGPLEIRRVGDELRIVVD